MKIKNTFRFILLTIIVISTFVSCHNDESKNTVDDVADTVKEGSWRISYFNNSGTVETENYEGYNFVFGDNAVVTASKETNTYNGQWFVNESTSDDDLFSTIFKISIGPNELFQNINRDWKLMDNSGSTLMLKDDSKGEKAIDYLTFEKIE